MARLPGDEKLPTDFAYALAANPVAKANFDALDFETRRYICDTINNAKGCGSRSILLKSAIRELSAS